MASAAHTKEWVVYLLGGKRAGGLNGRLLKRRDFGGPIALFRLSERIVNYLTEVR